jgi:hypothetical protein
MIQINDNGFFEIFPAIKTITESFEYQNAMLNKIVLTGKINALEIAENLFEFTEKTADTFADLQKKIIENLLEESKKLLQMKAELKAKSILSIFVKNLYELSKSIELLSNNKDVIDFLDGKISKEEIKKLLNEYKNSYSIYNEILILDKNKRVRANSNPKNKILKTKDEIIDKVFNSENYIQSYKKTDMFLFQKKSLFFAKRVIKDSKVIGAVVISLDLENEMKIVFDMILDKYDEASIIDGNGNILASNEFGIDVKSLKKINRIDMPIIANNRFNLKIKANNYKNYNINDLYVIISLKREDDINISLDSNETHDNIKQLTQINIRNPELKKLTDEAYSILEDLSDVIINGELIAAKSKQYILIPILDNLREVSFRVVKLIEVSISSLQKVISTSINNDVDSISKSIMFSILKIMYEAVNDIRWFSCDKILINELSSNTPNVEIIKEELSLLNRIYNNYYNIFVYDINGKVIAASKIGEDLEIEDKSSLNSMNNCFISEYKTSKFYNNNSTYIFYKSIIKDEKIVGGIGIVLDIKEFDEILDFEFDIKGFVLIVNKKREVITVKNTSKDIIMKLDSIELENGIIKDIEIDNKQYKIEVSHISKYREYENKNLFVIVAIEK